MPKKNHYLYEQGLSDYALDYLEASKSQISDSSTYSERLLAIMNNEHIMEQVINHTSELGYSEVVALPQATMPPLAEKLAELNQRRCSTRKYVPTGLTLPEVAQLLRLTYTVTAHGDMQRGTSPSRNIASGGGLYPVDLYYISRRTHGLRPGVYHYQVSNQTLERLPGLDDPADLEQQVNEAFFLEHKADMDYQNASGYLVLGGVLNRVCFKYLDRGLRYALIDAGAIIHSAYLASTALKIACCSMGGYNDDLAKKIIGFHGTSQHVLGVVVLGKMEL